jgi:hypothetical protein
VLRTPEERTTTMTTKISNRIAEAVHTVSRGRELDSVSSVLWEAVGLGLLTVAPSGAQEVTDAGQTLIVDLLRKKEAARARGRAAARARRDAMSSLGLTRTRSGTWE